MVGWIRHRFTSVPGGKKMNAETIKRLKKQLERWMAQQGDQGIETELNNLKSSKEAQWKPRLKKYYKANKDSYDQIFKGRK